jgi:hypothetical protein
MLQLGGHPTARWQTENHAQVSSAATGGLASPQENILKQLDQFNGRLSRLENAAHKSSAIASETCTAGVPEMPSLTLALNPLPAQATVS